MQFPFASLVVLSAWLSAPSLRCQYAPDDWFLCSDWEVYQVWDNQLIAAYAASPMAGNFMSVAIDRGETTYASHLGSVTWILVSSQGVATTGPFVSVFGFGDGHLGHPVVTHDRFWGIDRGGGFGYVPTSGLQPSVFIGNVLSPLGLAFPSTYVNGACTNGRELFFSVTITASLAHHVFAIDLQNPTAVPRPVARCSTGAGRVVPRAGPRLAIGPDGDLIALDGELWRIDPRTGAMQTISGPFWGTLPPVIPTSGSAVRFAYNVWDGTAIAGFSRRLHRFAGSTWSLRFNNAIPWQFMSLASTSPRPFLLYGQGCRNALLQEPRLGWRRLPRRGQSFDVTLRDAEPNGFAVFWVGGSKTAWPGLGSLPFNSAPLGAPGCQLLASSDFSFVVPTDAGGNATMTIPVPLATMLSGYEAFAQSASTSGHNVLGFATSDALAIRIR